MLTDAAFLPASGSIGGHAIYEKKKREQKERNEKEKTVSGTPERNSYRSVLHATTDRVFSEKACRFSRDHPYQESESIIITVIKLAVMNLF